MAAKGARAGLCLPATVAEGQGAGRDKTAPSQDIGQSILKLAGPVLVARHEPGPAGRGAFSRCPRGGVARSYSPNLFFFPPAPTGPDRLRFWPVSSEFHMDCMEDTATLCLLPLCFEASPLHFAHISRNEVPPRQLEAPVCALSYTVNRPGTKYLPGHDAFLYGQGQPTTTRAHRSATRVCHHVAYWCGYRSLSSGSFRSLHDIPPLSPAAGYDVDFPSLALDERHFR